MTNLPRPADGAFLTLTGLRVVDFLLVVANGADFSSASTVAIYCVFPGIRPRAKRIPGARTAPGGYHRPIFVVGLQGIVPH